MLSKKLLILPLVFVALSLFILNPYTIYGRPGIIVAFLLMIYGLYYGIKKQFFREFMLPSFMLLVIASFGVFSSALHGIFQINHLLSAISFNIIVFATYGLWVYCQRNGITKYEIISIVLFVIVLNAIIIILQLNFGSFRILIESFLDPLSGGSINYSEGFRLRGFASSGGAGLSISIPVALTLALYLFHHKVIPFYFLMLIIILLLASVLVIGRTGLILMVLPLLTYVVLMLNRKSIVSTILIGSGLFVILFLFYRFVAVYYEDMFGEAFINYAFGFLLDGRSGIKDEGTVSIIVEFLKVLPLNFPQIFTGYGFYGGSDFLPWTDSGYSRMFLSVGFIFGLLFYFIIFRIYFLAIKGNVFLFGTLILILAVAELKEPLLFSGVASRMFIIVLIFSWFQTHYSGKNNIRSST